MRYLIIISLLIAASSCQKEISCEDWGVCEDAPEKCWYPITGSKTIEIGSDKVLLLSRDFIGVGAYWIHTNGVYDSLFSLKNCKAFVYISGVATIDGIDTAEYLWLQDDLNSPTMYYMVIKKDYSNFPHEDGDKFKL